MSRPSTSSRFKRRRIRERRIADRGTQVGEEAEILSQAQQPRLGPDRVRHLVPLGSADGAEDHRVRFHGLGHRLVGDRHALGVDGSAADEIRFRLEFRPLATLVEEGDHALDLGHRFDADAVAGQEEQLVGGHGFGDPVEALCVSFARRY